MRLLIRISAIAVALSAVVALSAALAAEPTPEPTPTPTATTKPRFNEIRVIARGDDMGAAQAINDGCIEAFQKGIVRSVEVIVPGPWYLDAVRLINENPDLDVGVHLTLTSEWDNMKWRPLTAAPSLVDADGYLRATTRAFTAGNPKLAEVERELRAQIESAQRHLGKRLSHVSAHMGAATATPELKALTDKLAKQYKLRTDDGLQTVAFGNATYALDQRERSLRTALEKLAPGDWLLVEHPAYDTPETQGLSHSGYENVASDRSNVRRTFTNDEVLRVIKKRGIKLIGYNALP